MPTDVFSRVTGNLQRKGYVQIAGPSPNALAMFKQASGLGVPKLVCVVSNTSPASATFAQYESWFKQIMGRSGAGLLLLVQGNLSDGAIAQALSLGSGALGYGQVVCGMYDPSRDAYYLPQGAFGTYHLAWDQEILA
jgi:hypothetical protein